MLLFLLIVVFMLIAVGLSLFLIKSDHGEKEPIGALWFAAGLGFAGAIAAAYLESKVIPLQDIKAGAPPGAMLLSTLGIGFIEECCKFLPLAIYIYHKRYFNEHTDGIIYFALAGLGFGLPENILYTLQFGASTGVIRLVLTPIFHAAITGMVGFYLAKCKLEGKKVYTVLPVLSIATVLHGLYDFGLSSGNNIYSLISAIITIGLSINFFYLFMKAGDLDKEQGLSVVGHNSYCRTCGFQNPNHNLYCARCGMHA